MSVSSSLRRQLASLAAPSSSLLVPERKRSSIIFSPQEAAKYDKETFFQIGQEGVHELISVNKQLFLPFLDSILFSERSKKYERIMEDQETNAKVDEIVNEFLLALHPYLMMKAALKCMEWLVYRFHIERFNVDSILQCSLPYYDTKTFVMILQALVLEKYQVNQEWEWLVPCKNSGAPLRKNILFDNSNSKFIIWIFSTFRRIIHVHRRQPGNLRVFLGFMVSTIVGILNKLKNDAMSKNRKGQKQNVIGLNILNNVYELLKTIREREEYQLLKNNEEIYSMSYILIAMLGCCCREIQEMAEIVGSGLKQIFKMIVVNRGSIQLTETYLLLNLMIDFLNRKWHFSSARTFNNTLRDVMVVSENWNLSNLVTKLLLFNLEKKTLLSPEKVFQWMDDIELDIEARSEILRKTYLIYKEDKTKKERTKLFLKTFERQYPLEFEMAVEQDRTLAQDLAKFKDGKSAFTLADHPNNLIRAKAVKKLILSIDGRKRDTKKKMTAKKMKPLVPDKNKLAVALSARFSDDNDEVLLTLWKTKLKRLLKIFTPETLVKGIEIMLGTTSSLKSKRIGLLKLCEIAENCNSSEILKQVSIMLVPFLFPRTEKQVKLSLAVLKSSFASSNTVLKKYSSVVDKDDQVTFQDICNESVVILSSLEDNYKLHFLHEAKTPAQLTFGCILSSSVDICNHLLPVVNKMSCGRCTTFPVTEENFSQCVKFAEKRQKMSFELVLTSISKVPITDFAILFEVLKFVWRNTEDIENRETGMKFLQTFLPTCFTSKKEQYDFWRHILHQTANSSNSEEELYQLRTMMFMKSFLQQLENVEITSSYESEGLSSSRKTMKTRNKESVQIDLWEVIETIFSSSLRHESFHIRSFALSFLQSVIDLLPETDPVRSFVVDILQFESEIKTDPDQIGNALTHVFNDGHAEVKSTIMKTLKMEQVSEHRKIGLLVVCKAISGEIFRDVYPSAKKLLLSNTPSKYLLKLLACYDGTFNAELIQDALGHKEAARTILKKVDKTCFETYSANQRKAIFVMLVEKAMCCKDPEIKVSIVRCVRKWVLDASLVSAELNRSLEMVRRQVAPRNIKLTDLKQKETDDWVLRAEVVLELIQGKHRVKSKTKLIQPLFKILKKCIALEEQVPVEYLKQLVLTSLTMCCQDDEEVTKEESKDFVSFDVQTVIDCLRCSRNPQTHHHALILLNYAASRYHEQVLHGIMSLFTFMGNSILRQDDSYSTQLIQQTVVNIIPALAKTTKGETHRMSVSAGIFRVFTSAVQDIPVHRRLPVFTSLVETLGPASAMWQLCIILVDNALQRDRKRSNLNADMELAADLVWQFGATTVAQTIGQIYAFLASLPIYSNPDAEAFNQMKLRQSVLEKAVLDFTRKEYFKDVLITVHYVVELMGQICAKFSDVNDDRVEYDALLEKCLIFSKKISTLQEEKMFRLISHKNLDVIDKINAALDPLKFIEAVALILVRDDSAVKRKVLDILNQRILQKVEWFGDLQNLLELIPLLIEITRTSAESDEAITLIQTAFFSLKLLAKNLAVQYPDHFVEVFKLSAEHTSHNNKLLRASALLCISELFCLRSLILPNLNDVTNAILKAFKASAKLQNMALDLFDGVSEDPTKTTEEESSHMTAHLLCISTITCLNKMIENLGSFVGMKFLKKALIAVLSINKTFGAGDKGSHRTKVFDQKMKGLLKMVSSKIPIRNMILPIREAFSALLEDSVATSTLLRVLKDTLVQTSKPDFSLCVDSLSEAFIGDFLAVREKYGGPELIPVENAVIDCLISGIVLKTTESHFRPLYHRIFDWAKGNEIRLITFYRFSAAAAERLKTLFVTFAGHVMAEAVQVLPTNLELAKAILPFFYHIFSNDKEGFVTTERFNALAKPLVDLIESDFLINGEISVSEVNDCIVQLAVATNDLNRWQHLLELVGLKASHSNKRVRLNVITTVEAAAAELGKDFLPLLPPAVPFLAELMSDDEQEVETAAHKLMQQLENIVGEDLQSYFAT